MKKIILSFFIFILLINNASALKTFTNIGGDFTIGYSAGWSYTENYDGADQTFTSQTGRAKVRIMVVPSDEISLTQIVDNKEKDLKDSNIAFESNLVEINGVSGVEWTYSEYSTEQKLRKKQVILFPQGEKYYIITTSVADYPYSDNYAFYSGDFDQIINSFKVITKPTTTASVSGFEIHNDPLENFKIKYPSGWKIFENYGDRYLYIAYLYGESRTGIYVDVFSLGGRSFSQLVNDIKSNKNRQGIYLYNEKNITINNLKGIEWEFRYTNPSTFEVFVEKEVVLLFGNKYYVITAFSERDTYPQYSYLFDRIINSFGIIQSSTKTQIPIETITTPSPTSQPSANIRPSINLHGEKTDVVRGEPILLTLSAVTDITKGQMNVQLTLIPPSGMSVTSSEFVTSGPGQYTANYKVNPGDGRLISINLQANQEGDFEVKGWTVYYFGDDKANGTENTSILPIKVRPNEAPISLNSNPQIFIIIFVSLLIFIFMIYIFIFVKFNKKI